MPLLFVGNDRRGCSHRLPACVGPRGQADQGLRDVEVACTPPELLMPSRHFQCVQAGGHQERKELGHWGSIRLFVNAALP